MTSSNYQMLPDKWTDIYHEYGETGMGYIIATVYLSDGNIYNRVVINGGYITQAEGFNKIPFNVEEIERIQVTHDKWDFNERKLYEEQLCPICQRNIVYNPRYPKYICRGCVNNGVEIDGKLTPLSDLDIKNNSNISCVVEGHECVANEAHFGGTVVQIK